MREILFRGKTEEANRWIFGDLEHDSDGDVQILGTHSVFARSVDPETVGQFTGLTDKNGKQIFEGDICRNGDFTYLISWIASQYTWAGLNLKTKRKTSIYGIINRYGNKFVIIGNRYDNPELKQSPNDWR